MRTLNHRTLHLVEKIQNQEMERWVRSLTDAELLARLEAQYQRLVSAGWTEEEIFHVFPSLRDLEFPHVKVKKESYETLLCQKYRGECSFRCASLLASVRHALIRCHYEW